MATPKDYPEINALTLKEVRAALSIAYLNRRAIKEEFLPEFEARVSALEDRQRRLTTTEAFIARLQKDKKPLG